MHIDIADIYRAIDRTWAPKGLTRSDGWCIRDGDGGGKRVSAATRIEVGARIAAAEAAMDQLGQPSLFMIRTGEDDLDEALAARGYKVVDPVILYAVPAVPVPLAGHKAVFCDMPLAIMSDIWAAGGIDHDRLRVMDRVAGPKSYILVREGDRPAAVGFVAADGPISMIHAIEVSADRRRRGLGQRVIEAAQHWSALQGAETLALAVTDANTAARGLYAKIGMEAVGRYHYRLRQK